MKRTKYKLFTAALLFSIGLAFQNPMLNKAASIPKTELTNNTSADSEQMYGIGSTSKVFAAAAVMKLVDDGLVDLDAPLIEYITDFYMEDARYKDITPRMLLNHTSGLQGSTLNNAMLYGDNDSYYHDTLLTKLKTQRLKAAPGEYAVYCNDGFTLSEILVERVTGKTFTEFLEYTFWIPMGLTRTGTTESVTEQSNLAPVYYNSNIKLPNAYANVIGSGGMYATAVDLCKASQIFMHSSKTPFSILSKKSIEAMESEEFTKGYGLDPNIPSAMGYGLGWDSVESPIFSEYNIKAVTKGGDTSDYHSSLTVLPELNISCSVLTSGGSSSYNAIAVQEILMSYLEETGQLKRTDETSLFTEVISEPQAIETESKINNFTDITGYYQGAGVFKIDIADDNTLSIQSIGTKRDTTQTYTYIGDNSFLSTNGNYISAEGKLVSAQSGTRGFTRLTFQEEENGMYIGIVTSETIPGLGQQIINLPIAQKIEQTSLSSTLEQTWQARNHKEYLPINEKYTSTIYLADPSLKPMLLDELPGYLTEESGKFMTQIVSDENAYFFQKIPGQFGRDLIDIEFYSDGGKDYLSGQREYISIESIEELPTDLESITIDSSGHAEWFTTKKGMTEQNITITAPSNGHFYIYSYIDDKLTPVFSSLLGDNNNPLFLPKDARIAFVGEPGAVFQTELY